MLNYLLICGVSGSGKSTIEEQLNEGHFYYTFNKLNQVTTREMREEEINNPPYLFLTEQVYTSHQPHLIAKSYFQGDYYGTVDTSVESEFVINTIIVNRMGYDNVIADLKELYGEEDINIKTMRVLSNDPTKRIGRDDDSIKQEEDLLKDIADFDLVNNPENRPDMEKIVNNVIKPLFPTE